jgi:subtilisin family serine protease
LALLLVFSLMPIGIVWADDDAAQATDSDLIELESDTLDTEETSTAEESLSSDADLSFESLAAAEAAGAIVAPPVDAQAFVSDEIIVVYAEDAQLDEEIALIEEEIGELSATAETPTTELIEGDYQGQSMATVTLPDDVTVQDALLAAANSESVFFAQPNFIYLPLAAPSPHIPNDPYATNTNQWWLGAVNAFDAWGYFDEKYGLPASGRPNISIGIIDSGARLNHQDLAANLALDGSGIPYAWDAYRNRQLIISAQTASLNYLNYYGDFDTDDGHGTHVSGIAAAVTDNNNRGAGVSYNSRLIPVQVVNSSGGMTTDVITRGINYLLGLPASANLRVINMSLGATRVTDSVFHATVTKAYNAGVLVVASAGNIDNYYEYAGDITYPAAWSEVVSVASIRSDYRRSTWSQYNNYVNIAAPGESIGSTFMSGTNAFESMSGTSMASPVVAGIAALLFSYDPSLTPAQVKQILYNTARDRMTSDPYDAVGWDKYYGYGVVDARGALAYLAATRTPFTVRHYKVDYDGSTISLHSKRATVGALGATVYDDSYAISIPGYTYASGWHGTATSGVITSNGSLVLDLYYTRNPASDLNGRIFTISTAQPGERNIDITGRSKQAGARAIIADNTVQANQRFRFERTSPGLYRIIDVNSGLCLDINGGAIRDGAPIIQWPYIGGLNQQWAVIDNGDETFSFTSAQDPTYVMDVRGGGRSSGAALILWAANGQNNQKWTLDEITQQLPEGDYFIRTADIGNRSLDINGGSYKPGAAMLLWDFHGATNQQFHLDYIETSGYYTITIVRSGLSIDVTGGSSKPGARIIQWGLHGQFNQQWDVSLDPTCGNYFIRCASNGLSLDVNGGNTKNNGIIIVWGLHGQINQQWLIRPVP